MKSETALRKRMVMPLKKVINMAEWYLADNRAKHSRAACVEMRQAINQVKTMRERYAKI